MTPEPVSTPEAPKSFFALGNNEPIPDGLPDEVVAFLREARRAAGWCDHGERLEICPDEPDSR